MRVSVIPAILAERKDKLIKQLRQISKLSSYLQIDVADGRFVKNKTVLPAEMLDIGFPENTEIHLMANLPEKYVVNCKKAGFKKLIFHIESTKNPEILVEMIKQAGMKAGVAVNPGTKALKIKPFLNKVDSVLVMTVNPGRQGQKFLKSQLKKIRQIRKWSKKIDIEVDGGINPDTIAMAVKAGANKMIVGSYIFREKSIKTALSKLKRLIKD